jgi:hypothetical protein
MIVSFSLALGYMLWERRHEVAPPPVVAAPPAPVPAPPLPPTPPDPAPPVEAAAPRPDPSSEMPVEVTLRYLARLEKWEMRLRNSSEDNLTVEVRISNPSLGESQTQYTLAAYQLISIGRQGDVAIETGAQIRLQSAPYRDLIKVAQNDGAA